MKVLVKSILALALVLSVVQAAIVNTDVKRNIQLTTSVAKTDMTITFLNDGSSAVESYDLIFTEEAMAGLAHLAVSNNDAKQLSWKAGDVFHTISASNGETIAKVMIHTVNLGKPLPAGESMTIRVSISYGGLLKPHPESITQAETQLVRYKDVHYLLSPYKTNKCTTTAKLASASIQTSSQLEPTTIDGDTISYGPYTSIQPYSLSPLSIHFESNQPLLVAKKIQRDVEVSHWGNVAVEDFTHWINNGAQLKGGFSRYTYQMIPHGSGSALKEVEFTLPEGAVDVYYKDAIGNISTSAWNKRRLQIQPRYPLFGGWQTTFCVGFNLPVEKHLGVSKKSSDIYTLTIPVGPSYKNDIYVQDHVVKITLPEGASDIKVETPFSMAQTMESKITYLDTTGRPVVVLERSKLVNDQLSRQIKVTYRFSSSDLAREPMMLVGGTFLLFLVAIFFSHLSLNIIPEDPNAKKVQQAAVLGHVRKYVDLVDRRFVIAEDLDREINSSTSNYPKHKQQAKDQIDAIINTVNNILHQLEQVDSDSADIIREIETLFQAKFKAQAELHTAIQQKKPVDSLRKEYLSGDDEIQSHKASLAS